MARQAQLARRMERFDRGPSREMEEAARPITLQKILNKYPCLMMARQARLWQNDAPAPHCAGVPGEQKKLDWDGPVPLPLMVSPAISARSSSAMPASI